MEEDQALFKITIPIEHIGYVMGRLTELGASPAGLEPRAREDESVFKTKIPVKRIDDARALIAKIPAAKKEPVSS